jgi:hypothetical protein
MMELLIRRSRWVGATNCRWLPPGKQSWLPNAWLSLLVDPADALAWAWDAALQRAALDTVTVDPGAASGQNLGSFPFAVTQPDFSGAADTPPPFAADRTIGPSPGRTQRTDVRSAGVLPARPLFPASSRPVTASIPPSRVPTSESRRTGLPWPQVPHAGAVTGLAEPARSQTALPVHAAPRHARSAAWPWAPRALGSLCSAASPERTPPTTRPLGAQPTAFPGPISTPTGGQGETDSTSRLTWGNADLAAILRANTMRLRDAAGHPAASPTPQLTPPPSVAQHFQTDLSSEQSASAAGALRTDPVLEERGALASAHSGAEANALHIDIILEALYERLRLEFLRTYGTAGE